MCAAFQNVWQDEEEEEHAYLKADLNLHQATSQWPKSTWFLIVTDTAASHFGYI